MLYFNIENFNELNVFLQNKHIHDGYFQYAVFSQTNKEFNVNIVNDVWNDSLHMIFIDVCYFVSVCDYKWSDNETINCFVAIDGVEELPSFLDVDDHKDKLCFMWEMFSGNKLYIVCSGMKIG